MAGRGKLQVLPSFKHYTKTCTYRYKLTEELGRGSFCTAYLGLQADGDGKPVCIKVEKLEKGKNNTKQLQLEATLYAKLVNERGFPSASQYGEEKTYTFLAMDLLGPNLEELLSSYGNKFTIQCVCIMALQMITRVETLHNHDYIHQDIKPDNFLIGRHKKASTIYLCDMGFCKKYRDSKTKAPLYNQYVSTNGLTGTTR